MTLKEWMEWKGTDIAAISSDIGVHRSTVSRYNLGTLIPSLRTIRVIKDYTDGCVSEVDWATEAKPHRRKYRPRK